MNLTSNEEESKEFITKVEVNDDLETYTITYGDGHQTINRFDSIHNFNVHIHKMVDQYYRYRKDVSEEMLKWFKNSVINGLIDLILSLEAIFITTKFVPEGVLKTIMLLLIIAIGIGYELAKVRDIIVSSLTLGYLDDVKKFIDIQERLKVQVEDPNTKRKEDWYIANLSNIDLGTNIELYEKYAQMLNIPEIKEEESLRITKTLKGE